MKDAGSAQDSNSFAALQSSEADLLDSLPERSGKSDVNLLVEPEPTSNLGVESRDHLLVSLPYLKSPTWLRSPQVPPQLVFLQPLEVLAWLDGCWLIRPATQ
ncbi:hypothetical protein Nepgr_004067 [Nepenthes gracilis]|uniref:Uncharacterized protein n=1 Tax=Nepenthes gracilis TaxID=150966 RepID=A0AAD3S0N4_NEPGR|nr:hypothetical protein Nepgr_004067 [Nepenthes gracilis]